MKLSKAIGDIGCGVDARQTIRPLKDFNRRLRSCRLLFTYTIENLPTSLIMKTHVHSWKKREGERERRELACENLTDRGRNRRMHDSCMKTFGLASRQFQLIGWVAIKSRWMFSIENFQRNFRMQFYFVEKDRN